VFQNTHPVCKAANARRVVSHGHQSGPLPLFGSWAVYLCSGIQTAPRLIHPKNRGVWVLQAFGLWTRLRIIGRRPPDDIYNALSSAILDWTTAANSFASCGE